MKNYVSKINDRNLQRKRESGFTTYILYSILIIVFYNLSKIYPQLLFKKNYWDIITVIIPSFNIYLGIIIIMMTYSNTTNHISSIRIKLNSTKENLLDEIITYSLIILPLTCSLSVSIYQYFTHKYINWYLIIMSLLEILLIFLIFFVMKIEKKNINKGIEVFEGTGNKSDDRNIFSILTYLLGLSIIFVSIFNLLNNETNIGKLNVTIFGVLIYSIPCLVIKILDLREQDNFTTALENLEYEINVKQLDDNEIRIRLQQNYFGFFLNDWINNTFQLIEDFNLYIEEKRSQLETMKIDLSKIDKSKYPIEYKGRREKLVKFNFDIVLDIKHFYTKKINEVESFRYDAKIEHGDSQELSKLYKKLNEEFSEKINEELKKIKS